MHGSVELQSWGEDQRQDLELMKTIDILDGTKHNRTWKRVHKRFGLDDGILFLRGERGKLIVVLLHAVQRLVELFQKDFLMGAIWAFEVH